MIIPSIDLMNGQTVQLVGGRELKIEAGDPQPLARRFSLAGEIAVIDLDAAKGTGSNRDLIVPLLDIARCRVGGGIRDVEAALRWLDAGASKVILGTAATPAVLGALPAHRVIAALDAYHGEVVVEGWQTRTGESIADRMKRLQGLVSGYLITFVEREGKMAGTAMERVPELVAIAREAGARVTIAGGVTSAHDIAALDRMGADAQVGMALYSGALDLADAICAPLTSDRPDGLWPTIVVDDAGTTLGLAYSSAESVRQAVNSGRGIYHSRRRGVWTKGASSGNMQQLLRIDLDCDRDALRFTVRQSGSGFCHTGTPTCFGDVAGLPGLEQRLTKQIESDDTRSYTKRLLGDDALLRAKLIEEAAELGEARRREHVVHEAADLLYFLTVAMRREGVRFVDVANELDRRARKVSRRPGDAKPAATAPRETA
jgi:phosphoribosyl-AMP cyclohydrolase / phosphoribosyl-ATP pyrophosphohydrolase